LCFVCRVRSGLSGELITRTTFDQDQDDPDRKLSTNLYDIKLPSVQRINY